MKLFLLVGGLACAAFIGSACVTPARAMPGPSAEAATPDECLDDSAVIHHVSAPSGAGVIEDDRPRCASLLPPASDGLPMDGPGPQAAPDTDSDTVAPRT
jgi:hypothetical protein